MDHDEVVQLLLDNLAKTYALKRRHASFWNFHKKSTKELGALSEIFARLQNDLGSKILEWDLCEKDPPDIRMVLSDQRVIGVEVTELVNEAAIQAQITNPSGYQLELSCFGLPEGVNAIRNIVRNKEQKLLALTGYDQLCLLIHTDEPYFQSQDFIKFPDPILAKPSGVFDSVYLLFSYEPDKQQCPVLNLL